LAGTPALAPGAVFAGDFRVIEPLGKGGMGAVYVVEQITTGKRRALKVMHPQIARDERSRQRFEQEAKIASRIESDHVVEVVSAGVDGPSAVPWLAMELLAGETLGAAVARRGPLPIEETRAIFAQLGHALGAAHAAGIVHRDLKPDNVFLATARREGVPFTVKVLDFGIAKLVVDAMAGSAPTAALGTPLWMAPEQMDSNATIAPTADVWAIGLVAFFVLTAHSYWLGARATNASPLGVIREVLEDPIAPASERARQLGVSDRIPPGFDAWFARCVARSPNERWRDGREACAALDAVWTPPRHTTPETRGTRETQKKARTGVYVVAALGAVVLLGVGIVVLTQIDFGNPQPNAPAPKTTKTSDDDTTQDDDPSPKKKKHAASPTTTSTSPPSVSTGTPAPESTQKCTAFGKSDTCEAQCDHGDKESCTELASIYYDDYVRRALARKRGCDLGDSTACFVFAEYTRLGVGVPSDEAKAKTIYAKACSLGNAKACDMK
jgi:serine/threonine protein kinase